MTARRLARLATGIAFLLMRAAGAAALPFLGELSIEIHGSSQAVLLFTIPGAGAVDVNPLGGVHLTQASVAEGEFESFGIVQSFGATPLFPIVGAMLTARNAAGLFAGPVGGPFGGTMPLQGAMKLCLFGPCSAAVANLSLPLSAIGQGGAAFVQGAVNLTLIGAPWTTGTAQVGELAVQGSARGPGARASSTAQLGGSLNLVSPVFISSNLGTAPVIPAFSRLRLLFGGTPECSDGVDNDGDGLTDHPADTGCLAADDFSEQQAGVACDDGIDNDGDGFTDYPDDPSCDGPAASDEDSCDEDLVTGPPNTPPPPTAPVFLDLGIAGGSAQATSADGTVVVGLYECGSYRWTALDGMGWLGTLADQGAPHDVSADGLVVVGDANNTLEQSEAFRWAPADGMTGLGTLADDGYGPSWAYGTSADGAVVVGDAYRSDLATWQAFRWTGSGGMEGLGFLPGDDTSRARDVSGDGSLVVGESGHSQSGRREAVVWQVGGGMFGLGDLGHTTTIASFAYAISRDGTTVIGTAQKFSTFFMKPFRWTAATGMTELSLASGTSGNALAVSADGAVVLGIDNGLSGGGRSTCSGITTAPGARC